MLQGIFVEVFSKLEDPRVERTKKHRFLDVIGLALFATLAAAQAFTEMEDFCKLHLEWLKNYFKLPNGIPSHDTFCRLFSAEVFYNRSRMHSANNCLSPQDYEKASGF